MAELKFDPVLQDWIRDGKGGFVRVDGSETTVLHQMLTHYQQDALDPESGSRFYMAELFAADPAALSEDEARRTLDLLVSRGIISDVEVSAIDDSTGRVTLDIGYRDVASGVFNRLSLPLQIGIL